MADPREILHQIDGVLGAVPPHTREAVHRAVARELGVDDTAPSEASGSITSDLGTLGPDDQVYDPDDDLAQQEAALNAAIEASLAADRGEPLEPDLALDDVVDDEPEPELDLDLEVDDDEPALGAPPPDASIDLSGAVDSTAGDGFGSDAPTEDALSLDDLALADVEEPSDADALTLDEDSVSIETPVDGPPSEDEPLDAEAHDHDALALDDPAVAADEEPTAPIPAAESTGDWSLIDVDDPHHDIPPLDEFGPALETGEHAVTLGGRPVGDDVVPEDDTVGVDDRAWADEDEPEELLDDALEPLPFDDDAPQGRPRLEVFRRDDGTDPPDEHVLGADLTMDLMGDIDFWDDDDLLALEVGSIRVAAHEDVWQTVLHAQTPAVYRILCDRGELHVQSGDELVARLEPGQSLDVEGAVLRVKACSEIDAVGRYARLGPG